MDANDFDKRKSLFLAAVCRQTYIQFENPGGECIVPLDHRLVSTFEARFIDGKTERFGFILESDDSTIVAFRGTVSTVDWIADFVARQAKFPFVRDAGWTHRGITDIYGSVRSTILSELNKVPAGKKRVVTGHSLGGALATLCAIDLASNSAGPPPDVYTFGAPRVGDPAFARAYNARIGCSHRVYNRYDIVPHLPTLLYKSPVTDAVYPYMHVKGGYRLQFGGRSVSANHVIGGYFSALAELDADYARSMCGSRPGFCP